LKLYDPPTLTPKNMGNMKKIKAWAVIRNGKIVEYSYDDWVFSYGIFNKKYLAEKYHQEASEKVIKVEIVIKTEDLLP
jgi:hypothetical protein